MGLQGWRQKAGGRLRQSPVLGRDLGGPVTMRCRGAQSEDYRDFLVDK